MNLECREIVLVGNRNPFRGGVVELSLAGIGVGRPVRAEVVLALVLVHDARRDLQVVGRLIQQRETCGGGVRSIRVLVGGLSRGSIDAVDPAAVEAVPDACAKAEHAIDDGLAVSGADLIAWLAIRRVRDFGARVGGGRRDARLYHDVAHGAALGTRAEEGALRTAQHLDAVEIERLGQRVVGIESDRPHLNGGVIDIDAGGARAAGGGNAANRNRVRAGGVDRHARHEAHHLGHVANAFLIERILVERGDADRYLADALLAPRRGDDDFLECAGSAASRRCPAYLHRSPPQRRRAPRTRRRQC